MGNRTNGGRNSTGSRMGGISDLCFVTHMEDRRHSRNDKVGLLLRRCSGTGLHLAMMGEPRGFSRGVAGFSNYDGEFRMPLV